jgi:starch phosphorylase
MFFKDVFVYPRFPNGLKNLLTLSYNIWSLWDKDAVKLFYKIDGELFKKVGRNPIAFLHNLPEEKLKDLENDKTFINELNKVWQKFNDYQNKESDFKNLFNNSYIAYFSMEYGLHDCLPIFAGGLGILSGDHIKGSSDIKLPIIGIGLLYRYGYFNQKINVNGMQEEIYYENTPYYIPVKELKNPDGSSVYVEIPMIEKNIKKAIAFDIYVPRQASACPRRSSRRTSRRFSSPAGSMPMRCRRRVTFFAWRSCWRPTRSTRPS